jgi:hypothetical protein
MSVITAKPEHEVAYQDLCALVSKHADKVSAYELLAIAANMLGKLVALQDQRIVTTVDALELISRNVEIGNQQVIEQLSRTCGSV